MARSAQSSAKSRPPVMWFSPERGRILSGQRSEGPALDLFHRSRSGDPAVLRRALVARCRPLAIGLDQRPGLRAVNLEALPHCFLAIFVALHERLAGNVVPPLC